MSCNQFQKDTVALRVFKPWRFKLNHTCHTRTVSLMSLCKYLIFSICITQPSLSHQPLLPAFSNTLIWSYKLLWFPELTMPFCAPHIYICTCLWTPILPSLSTHLTLTHPSRQLTYNPQPWFPKPSQFLILAEFLISLLCRHCTLLTFHNSEYSIYLFNKLLRNLPLCQS